MITKLAPCNDNVLIRPVEAEKESPGGIALPESLQERERPSRGTIVAVGPGKVIGNRERIKVRLEAGAEVYYGRYAGTEIEHKGVTYRLMAESEVLAKVVRA
ncbi:MAG TPA: co-chaperone GroES [Phycisphaerae bacterium]|nr:co-chaperone GroES [Phycisphaerae bacterium]